MKSLLPVIACIGIILFASCAKEPEEGTVNKVIETYSVTLIQPDGGGNASMAPVKDKYQKGEVVTLTAVPSEGYLFSGWSGIEGATDNPLTVSVSSNLTLTPVFTEIVPERQWTFVVYMSADNDLEESAISDINELESVDWSSGTVTVLALIDRMSGYDSTNGDWTDTRLYKITSDPAGDNQTIVSERLGCDSLGISVSGITELNMANPLVLSRVIDFAKKNYPAEKYGCIVWGHGTGWRSTTGLAASEDTVATKAVAWDETSSAYMPVCGLHTALDGKGLECIAFDTCFAGTLEVLYELRSDAKTFLGSPGLVPSNGWAYGSVFSDFLATAGDTAGFCASVLESYAAQYNGVDGASFISVDLASMTDVFSAFESFSGILAQNITSQSLRNIVLDEIIDNIALYHASSYPSDCYIDVNDFTKKMTVISSGWTEASEISSSASELLNALSGAVKKGWVSGSIDSIPTIAVNFIPFIASNTPSSTHDIAYIRGSGASNQSTFVKNSGNWVPQLVPSATSMLDKLFYWSY